MTRTLPFFILLALLSGAPFAHADNVVVGQACSTLGLSELSTDQKNIAVCLRNDSGALVWKSSTSSAVPQGIWCGENGIGCNGGGAAPNCPSGYSAAAYGSTTSSNGDDTTTTVLYTCYKN